jgi:UDP-N-acetylmuramyl pentapeptide phosphotransferase/UDP-N-acetylglucosamine-1-phosphate transferase
MTILILSPLIPYVFEISETLDKKLTIVVTLAALLGIVSALDDLDTIGKSHLSVPPWIRLAMQIGVGLVIGITSIKIAYVSNIFGGVMRLDEYYFQLETLGRVWTFYYIPILLTTLWYVLVFNSINFSDGIPGLT